MKLIVDKHEYAQIMGYIYSASKSIQALGGCSEQITVVYQAWPREAKLCVST